MSKIKFPKNPAHPERICWGCQRFCRSDDLYCGNEVVRASHPIELFGPDWWEELELAELTETDPPHGDSH